MLFLYIALVISLIRFGILLCIKYFGKSYGDIIVEEIEEKINKEQKTYNSEQEHFDYLRRFDKAMAIMDSYNCPCRERVEAFPYKGGYLCGMSRQPTNHNDMLQIPTQFIKFEDEFDLEEERHDYFEKEKK